MNNEYVQLTQDYFARKADAFHNGTLSCSFKDDSKKYINHVSQYKIGLLWNVKTLEGSRRYEETQMFVELMNQDGGINGRELKLITTKYNDDVSMINDIVIELCKDENLLFFIGTTTTAERNAINATLIEYDKLCFSFQPSSGQVAYRNIIILNRLPHQHMNYQYYVSLELFDSYSIVYDNTTEYITYIFK